MKSRKALKKLFELQMKVKEFQEKIGDKFSDDLAELIKLAGATKEIIIEESDDTAPKNKDKGDLFQQIFRNISDTVYLTDLEGNFTFVCENVDVILGYTRDELLHKGNIECVLGENLFKLKKLLSNGEIKNIVRSVADKNGEIHSLLVNVKKVALPGGEILFTCRDVTERKKTIQDLVETRIFSQNLIESMKDGFCITDRDGDILDVNTSMCRITGYTKTELIGTKSPYDYWSEEDVDKIFNEFSNTTEGILEDVELTLKRKNGEMFSAIVSPARVENPDGDVVVYFATIKDISDIKRYEHELVEKTNFLNTIIKDAAVSMWISDDQGLAVDSNKACLELIGMQMEDFIGKYSILEDRNFKESGIMPKLEDVFSKGQFADFTLDLNDINESKLQILGYKKKVIRTIINPVFGIDGKVSNAIIQSIDLTEIKKVESELEKHKENLEELVRDRTLELEEKNLELENFNKLFVGREFRIKELKDKLKDMESKG